MHGKEGCKRGPGLFKCHMLSYIVQAPLSQSGVFQVCCAGRLGFLLGAGVWGWWGWCKGACHWRKSGGFFFWEFWERALDWNMENKIRTNDQRYHWLIVLWFNVCQWMEMNSGERMYYGPSKKAFCLFVFVFNHRFLWCLISLSVVRYEGSWAVWFFWLFPERHITMGANKESPRKITGYIDGVGPLSHFK